MALLLLTETAPALDQPVKITFQGRVSEHK